MNAPFEAPSIWGKPWFERIYRIGIVIKGIDGILEFVAGFAILISPHLVHMLLSGLIGELGEHTNRPFQFVAEYIGHVDTQLLHSGLVFLTLFLIFHGIIKIVLVYCLVRRIERAYPVTLVLLVAFWLYEIYVFVGSLSIPLALFIILDAAIIWLVWNEYNEMKAKRIDQTNHAVVK